MYILSVDTTAKTAAVCIARTDSTHVLVPTAQFSLGSTLTHSESLLPMTDMCIKLSGLSLSDIDYLAITSGPGSFTGVRIGVAALKGLSFSRGNGIPCIPLSTLLCLARNCESYGENTVICPVMDARREQFYNALFTVKNGKTERICDDRVITGDELIRELAEKFQDSDIVICGDGASLFYGMYKNEENAGLSARLAYPGDIFENAFSVAQCAYDIINSESFDASDYTGEKLSPTYLRLSQAERELNEKTKNDINENKI